MHFPIIFLSQIRAGRFALPDKGGEKKVEILGFSEVYQIRAVRKK